MCTSFLDKVLQVSRGFFEQPMEEKMKYAKGVEEFEGYGADPVPQEGQPLDWSDRLYLNVHPQDMRNYKFWPKNPVFPVSNLAPLLLGILKDFPIPTLDKL
ncbi:unnamed protein product [Cuscuta europaea]|uniref:Non-haem dioxygenase N-terminal domain-containing protein n=1 Tax=Cuscuta europaea TaxID=41803 RepID=A0A9P0Z461_CUSEU|nr:unnamed protein product [Cuscuta europaea]